MRTLESDAIESGHVTGLDLMERAGQGVLNALDQAWPDIDTAVILCGPGKNGGDGFVIARLLAARGCAVTVFAWGWDALLRIGVSHGETTPDARRNAEIWLGQGGRTLSLHDPGGAAALSAALCQDGARIVVIDALLGVGQNRETDTILRGFGRAWDAMCNLSPDNRITTLSVDVPTGYDTDSGAPLGYHPFEPDLIVTFHAHKPVHDVLGATGVPVQIVDIGLPGAGAR